MGMKKVMPKFVNNLCMFKPALSEFSRCAINMLNTTTVDDNHRVDNATPPRHLPTGPHGLPPPPLRSLLSCSATSSPNADIHNPKGSTAAPTLPSPPSSLRDAGTGVAMSPPINPRPMMMRGHQQGASSATTSRSRGIG